MSSVPSTRRLLRESLPIAVILAVWTLPTELVLGGTGQALFVGGLVMAGLYAVVRGTRLATRYSVADEPTDLSGVVRENGRVLLAAGVWFLAAQGVWLSASLGPGTSDTPLLGVLLFALNGAGAGAALLYAITVGRARLVATDANRATGAEPDVGGATSVDG